MPNLSKVVVKQLEKLLTKDGWLERWIAKNSERRGRCKNRDHL